MMGCEGMFAEYSGVSSELASPDKAVRLGSNNLVSSKELGESLDACSSRRGFLYRHTSARPVGSAQRANATTRDGKIV